MAVILNEQHLISGKTFIVLEAGPTHNGLESAKALIKIASDSGADAIKFQMIDTDRLIADKNIMFGYQFLEIDEYGNENFIPIEEPLADILKRRELTRDEWRDVKRYCDELGIYMFSTATYKEEVDFLVDDLKIDSIKVNSGDVNDLQFIRYCAKKGVNIQLDTGNADIWEIERAVIEAEEAGCHNIIIHLCPSGYPAHLESIHLNMITTLRQMFPNYGIAFSDHSPGWDMDIAAVALGVVMVEKTITLDRTIKSCEHSFSLEQDTVKKFVQSIRDVEKALGSTRRNIPTAIKQSRKKTRRSPYALRDIPAGEAITLHDFDFKRPGFGITSEEFEFFVEKKLKIDIKKGKALTYDYI